MSFSSHLCFQPRTPTAVPENARGNTPKHAAKRLVPEPDAVSLCCTDAKKSRKWGKRVTLYLFLSSPEGTMKTDTFSLRLLLPGF